MDRTIKVAALLRERGKPLSCETICKCCGLSMEMLAEVLQSPLFVRLGDGSVELMEWSNPSQA